MNKIQPQTIAVIIPCYNEESTIQDVIRDFKIALPRAEIHVFNNNSSDKTEEIARKSGALVHTVYARGKGNVVRRMFADIDADIYVMVDGDATYDAASAPKLVAKLIEGEFDMVVGSRYEESKDNNNYRTGHRLGNKILTGVVQQIFGGKFTDMLSGYRVFSRRYVKSFPALSKGFETETELTVHALELSMPYAEVQTPYNERPLGSVSKLSTYKDGWRILKMVIRMYASEKPFHFFGIIALILFILATILMVPVVITFMQTQMVPKLPTVVLAGILGLSALLSFLVGLILNTVTVGRKEAKHLAYLSIKLK